MLIGSIHNRPTGRCIAEDGVVIGKKYPITTASVGGKLEMVSGARMTHALGFMGDLDTHVPKFFARQCQEGAWLPIPSRIHYIKCAFFVRLSAGNTV